MALLTLLSSSFLLLALYCALDPFKHSAISDFRDFKAHRVEMPPLAGLPAERDTEKLLQKFEIKFFNQIQGHESMVFDPLGRGPYIGVADGRILFWNGGAWTDFAYTSSNRDVGSSIGTKTKPLFMNNKNMSTSAAEVERELKYSEFLSC